MRRLVLWFCGFLAAAAWFALLISWTRFADPDAFYHAKMAQLVWAQGPLQSFPWLDLTLLGSHFADLHIGFHFLLAPFVAAFGLFDGTRIAAVLLCAAFMLVLYGCLRWLKLPYALWWTILLAFTQPFLVRMLLGKATPLALLWFILGLTAFWKRRPWLVALITCLFALSHGGWPYLAGSCLLLAFGEVAYARMVSSYTLKRAIVEAPWKGVVAAFLGAGLGLVLHPNFPNDLIFSWTQIVVIGLGTPFQHVMLGSEWLPSEPYALLASFAPWIVAAIFGFLGLFLAAKKPLDQGRARLLTAFGWIFAVLVALTLKSRRNVEYLAPIFAMWTAALWSLVDVPRFWHEAKEIVTSTASTWARRIGVPVVAVLLIFMLIRNPLDAYKELHAGYADSAYRPAMKLISDTAHPGDRVFHSSWDEFPMLFAADDRLRYIAGLDPTFLYVASSTASDQVRDVTWGVTTSTHEAAWSLIHDQLHSRFVFITKPNHMAFYRLIDSDPRYEVLYDATDTASFLVSDTD